jgi:arsenite/tail-anchored protein-transporting ATPase
VIAAPTRPVETGGRHRLKRLSTPRTILYTGKGGVGKTSVAAATARRCAAAGLRTLVLSTDPAHSLSDSLGVSLGGDPTVVDGLLSGLEVDSQREMLRNWAGVQGWLGEILIDRGIDRIAAEELTVPPGMDELFALLRLQEQHGSGDWDAIIVDCAPTGETLRMLSFPEVARWWLNKVFPMEQVLISTVGPMARSLLDLSMPLPGSAVFSDLERLSRNLLAMNEILRDLQHTTVRLVMNPDRMVIGEAMRTFTYLNMYGYLTDAVIVNRVFPREVGTYFERWRELQEEHLALVRSAFAPVPVLEAPFYGEEVIGVAMLDQLGEALFASAADAAALLYESVTQSVVSTEGGAILRLALPFAKKDQISLKQVGRELIVSVAGAQRTIALPPALAAMRTSGARYDEGALEVSFTNE